MRRFCLVVGLLIHAAAPLAAQEAGRFDRWDRAERWSHWEPHDGIHFRLGRDYHLPPDGVATEPIVVVGANATIDGRADEDVVIVGGELRLGPQAVVRGDITSIGGTLVIDPGAEVNGGVTEAAGRWPDIAIGWPRFDSRAWAAALFGFTIVRLSLTFVAALLLTLVAPRWVSAIAHSVSRSPVGTAFLGLAGELLLLPAVLIVSTVLAISIIGIPLLGGIPFLLAALAVMWIAGFTAAAARLGASVRGRPPAEGVTLGDVSVGFGLLTALSLVGHLVAIGGAAATSPAAVASITGGLLLEYVAWTIGLGGAIRAFMHQPHDTPPPPLPVTSAGTAPAM